MPRLVDVPGYIRFWTASAVSAFGSQVSGLALQILTAVTLSASATEVGLVSAARWAPYLLFGLVAGVLVDRCRRKPMMVAMDLGRGALLSVIPLLYALDRLSIAALCVCWRSRDRPQRDDTSRSAAGRCDRAGPWGCLHFPGPVVCPDVVRSPADPILTASPEHVRSITESATRSTGLAR